MPLNSDGDHHHQTYPILFTSDGNHCHKYLVPFRSSVMVTTVTKVLFHPVQQLATVWNTNTIDVYQIFNNLPRPFDPYANPVEKGVSPQGT